MLSFYFSEYYIEVVCESVQYQKSPCAIAGYVINVDLKTQRSEADCIKDETYGYYHGDVWTDKGCRGKFTVTMQGNSSFILITFFIENKIEIISHSTQMKIYII